MRNYNSILKKVLLGMLAFTLILLGRVKTAEAETIQGYSDMNIEVTDAAKAKNVDLAAVMSALEGRTITNGDSFYVDGKYRVECKVTMKNANSSGLSIDNVSQNYTGLLNVYVTILLGQVKVAEITHNVNITFYDSGLVHINSGSLGANTYVVNWTGSALDYQIVNTDGSYSTSGGRVELHDTAGGGYYYYSCWVSVSTGNSPQFTFNPIPR